MKELLESLAKKEFNNSDQHSFATLSGDFNPIHLDESIAKKTISGSCIVHGINLLLWSLDSYVQRTQQFPESIRAKFLKPTIICDEVELYLGLKPRRLLIKNTQGLVLVEIIISRQEYGFNFFEDKPLPEFQKISKPVDFLFHKKNHRRIFASKYAGDRQLAKTMYPNLSKVIGINCVYEVSSLSNIVGMQLPGLHSILVGCELSFRTTDKGKSLTYSLDSYDERFKHMEIGYSGYNLDAKINAFKRPVYQPKDCKEISNKADKNKTLGDRKILIIGGSRGIGAAVAKVATFQGANVTISYCSNKSDAIEVRDNILATWGKIIDIQKIDINDYRYISEMRFDFDTLCYFATPKIFVKEDSKFNQEVFNNFHRFYCSSFELIASRFIDQGGSLVYYPSTIAIEDKTRTLEEYIKAKWLGECICRDLQASFRGTIIIDRLARVATDQTLTILPVDALDPVEVAFQICRQLSQHSQNSTSS